MSILIVNSLLTISVRLWVSKASGQQHSMAAMIGVSASNSSGRDKSLCKAEHLHR
jgi:hypothetical protein